VLSKDHGVTAADAQQLSGLRVLIVEDAWLLASALKALLESMGMEIVGPVATVVEAERLAVERRAEVAVVDVNLRSEMAYGLIDELHDRGVPVIVVSGYAILPRLTDKAAAILQKPFNGPELLAAVQQAVGISRSRPIPPARV
jgi:DNA-binding NtrC family response regulator